MSTADSAAPRGSVVIPAHDESAVLGRLLARLQAGGALQRFRVVVVANGCHDDTADVARRFPGVEVVETPVGSKVHALNLGDEHAGPVFPRAYLDADVVVDAATLEATFAALDDPGVQASAPFALYDRGHGGLLARAYVRVLEGLPVFDEGYVGSGCYAVSAAGRARFDTFPDLVGDDRYVDGLFWATEKRTLHDHPMTVFGPRTLRAVVRRGARVKAGSVAVDDAGSVGSAAVGNRNHLLRLARRPTAWPDLAVFVAAHVAVIGVTRWNRWRGRDVGWARDDSRG